MMMIINHVDYDNDADDINYDEYDNNDDDDRDFHSKIENVSRNALSLICRNDPIYISLIFMRLWACYIQVRVHYFVYSKLSV